MTEEEFLDARDLMTEAVKRAEMIVGYIGGSDETARVDLLEDGVAVLISWQSSSDYDGPRLEKEEQHFPAHLLFCPEAAVNEWKSAQKKATKQKREAQILLDRAQAEAHERAVYQALKAKYE